jgi:hypothetical protein
MSRTVTMEVPTGTINPITGHMENADDLALHRAIGPDQPDPPSSAGRSRSEPPRIPFGWPRGGPRTKDHQEEVLEDHLEEEDRSEDHLEEEDRSEDHLVEEDHQGERQCQCLLHQPFQQRPTTQN